MNTDDLIRSDSEGMSEDMCLGDTHWKLSIIVNGRHKFDYLVLKLCTKQFNYVYVTVIRSHNL